MIARGRYMTVHIDAPRPLHPVTLVPYASGGPVTVVWDSKGNVKNGVALGFGSSLGNVDVSQGPVTGASGYAFALPRDLRVGDWTLSFTTTSKIVATTAPVQIVGRLLLAAAPGASFLPFLDVLLDPLNGTVGVGRTVSGVLPDTGRVLSAGSQLLCVVMASGPSSATVLSGVVQGGLTLTAA